MKKIAKRIVNGLAANFGSHRWPVRQPRLWILMYHRVLPVDDPRARLEEPGMMVTPETFRRHLEWLCARIEPVRLQDWIAAMHSDVHSVPPKAFAVTFDDGWADNYEYAFPLLKEADVPAAVFLVSHMIGTPKEFWPNRLTRLLHTLGREADRAPGLEWLRSMSDVRLSATTDPESRSALIQACKQLDDQHINDLLDTAEAELGTAVDGERTLLDWPEVEEMVASGLVDVGSHTRYHRRLRSGISSEVIEQEVRDSQAHLEHRLGRPVTLFCYPNGDYTAEVEGLVRATYSGAVTTKRGVNSTSTPLTELRRIGLHEGAARTRTELYARLSALTA